MSLILPHRRIIASAPLYSLGLRCYWTGAGVVFTRDDTAVFRLQARGAIIFGGNSFNKCVIVLSENMLSDRRPEQAPLAVAGEQCVSEKEVAPKLGKEVVHAHVKPLS